ncbi:MAG: urease accessory protein UreG [Campylobacteraceae bacterium]|jgi:urease accessory protein|nr:urease accessory protein UreG [Campylobacteraceae bacterium]
MSAVKIGIAGPVGSGKTSIIEELTKMLQDSFKIAIVTNDIYTKEDADYLKSRLNIPSEMIIGVETGGCPHTAIRDDISMNKKACEELEKKFNPEIIFVESGGDNLSTTFSYELVDFYIYVIDVAQGGDIPRKKGAGLIFCDLLIINKTDLAPFVDVDLNLMLKDVKNARQNRPFVFVSKKEPSSLLAVKEWVEALRS